MELGNTNDTEASPPNAGRLPGMKAELLQMYEGLQRIGATSPASAQTVQRISKELHLPRNRARHALEELEGKGVVAHLTAGKETTWFTRR